MFGMGCSRSAPIQEINAEENEGVNLSKENNANGIAHQPGQAKADGIETTANSLQDTNPAEGNQLGLGKKRNSLRQLRPKRDGQQIINDAWGKSTVTKNVETLENLQPRHKPEELVDLESEYGKDGVDLASSDVRGDHQERKQKLINNCDRTYSVDNSERMSNQRNIYRDDTDEIFDPSTLIDIEKFRAVNAPTKQISTSNRDSGTDENGNEQEVTGNTIKLKEAAVVLIKSPDFSDMYNDDEKQLIASIEKDFKNISPAALPGSVM